MTRVPLAIYLIVLFSKNAETYLALVDFEIVRFRILDREHVTGGSRCDSDWIGGRYNPCDFVFYVKNCTQVPRDGGRQCTTRIDRYYAPENTDDVIFSDSHPVTSFILEYPSRETLIRVEVNDQDDGYSADDPIGVYELRVSPEVIDPRGQQFASITEQVILIPDHSELTVRYRAYCTDDECRIRRPGFDAPRIPGSFGQLRSDQPSEAWTISKSDKEPSKWSGTMRPAAGQQAPGPFGFSRFGPPQEALLPPQALQGHFPIAAPGQFSGQRPPFAEWPQTSSIAERSAFSSGSGLPASSGGESNFGWVPAPPANPPGPNPALSSNSIGASIDQKGVQSQAPHLLGFHCVDGRCTPDQGQSQQPFQSPQHDQKRAISQQVQEFQSTQDHRVNSGRQVQPPHNQEEHPFQSQWRKSPDHQQSGNDDGHPDKQTSGGTQKLPDEHHGTSSHESDSHQKLKEEKASGVNATITNNPFVMIQVMDASSNERISSSNRSQSAHP